VDVWRPPPLPLLLLPLESSSTLPAAPRGTAGVVSSCGLFHGTRTCMGGLACSSGCWAPSQRRVAAMALRPDHGVGLAGCLSPCVFPRSAFLCSGLAALRASSGRAAQCFKLASSWPWRTGRFGHRTHQSRGLRLSLNAPPAGSSPGPGPHESGERATWKTPVRGGGEEVKSSSASSPPPRTAGSLQVL